jgi:hypothetical protein
LSQGRKALSLLSGDVNTAIFDDVDILWWLRRGSVLVYLLLLLLSIDKVKPW